ncbi:hypothetical protein SDRG_13013 [Saprolegnia diclina VS20]|uniref:Uncharacterized protein n=1 Tax=Saprolegnia diclina (strain VS20) TaxID=1156394 RepID=T0PV03_SAPDV|nr:hypothetical protein SDRG_13013 [Saprolegnia diclina VS20]EQC29344.1 hypothetical protein SDRG_13013 [Saprolegnia diclina VS20]|eukprot:XP_008617318.1 hypothetical protein SDRG_13013 [Saprolegnia diclina VS20]
MVPPVQGKRNSCGVQFIFKGKFQGGSGYRLVCNQYRRACDAGVSIKEAHEGLVIYSGRPGHSHAPKALLSHDDDDDDDDNDCF